jgi:hypothetical protein
MTTDDELAWSAAERDRLIMRLHGLGCSAAQISKHTGLTRRGVAAAIRRIKEGRAGES